MGGMVVPRAVKPTGPTGYSHFRSNTHKTGNRSTNVQVTAISNICLYNVHVVIVV